MNRAFDTLATPVMGCSLAAAELIDEAPEVRTGRQRDSWPLSLRMPPLPSSAGRISGHPENGRFYPTAVKEFVQSFVLPAVTFALHAVTRYCSSRPAGVRMTLQRIEAALERLEAAAQHSTPGLAQIQTSNAKLREAVTLSLSQIDALIARHGAEVQP